MELGYFSYNASFTRPLGQSKILFIILMPASSTLAVYDMDLMFDVESIDKDQSHQCASIKFLVDRALIRVLRMPFLKGSYIPIYLYAHQGYLVHQIYHIDTICILHVFYDISQNEKEGMMLGEEFFLE